MEAAIEATDSKLVQREQIREDKACLHTYLVGVIMCESL